MKRIAVVLLAVGLNATHAQQVPAPIIDMHLHALPLAEFEALGGAAPVPHCVPMTDYPVPESARTWLDVFRSRDLSCRAVWSPTNDDAVLDRTLEIMRRRNVFGVTSGSRVDLRKKTAPEPILASLSVSGRPRCPVPRTPVQPGYLDQARASLALRTRSTPPHTACAVFPRYCIQLPSIRELG